MDFSFRHIILKAIVVPQLLKVRCAARCASMLIYYLYKGSQHSNLFDLQLTKPNPEGF